MRGDVIRIGKDVFGELPPMARAVLNGHEVSPDPYDLRKTLESKDGEPVMLSLTE